jgi:hypothetical protein
VIATSTLPRQRLGRAAAPALAYIHTESGARSDGRRSLTRACERVDTDRWLPKTYPC